MPRFGLRDIWPADSRRLANVCHCLHDIRMLMFFRGHPGRFGTARILISISELGSSQRRQNMLRPQKVNDAFHDERLRIKPRFCDNPVAGQSIQPNLSMLSLRLRKQQKHVSALRVFVDFRKSLVNCRTMQLICKMRTILLMFFFVCHCDDQQLNSESRLGYQLCE
ncbi:hypothetical protein JOE11_002128 [Robbsia andropogonis]